MAKPSGSEGSAPGVGLKPSPPQPTRSRNAAPNTATATGVTGHHQHPYKPGHPGPV